MISRPSKHSSSSVQRPGVVQRLDVRHHVISNENLRMAQPQQHPGKISGRVSAPTKRHENPKPVPETGSESKSLRYPTMAMDRAGRYKSILYEPRTGSKIRMRIPIKDAWLTRRRLLIEMSLIPVLGSALFSGVDQVATALVWGCFGRELYA